MLINYPFRRGAAGCAWGDALAQGNREGFDTRLYLVVGVFAVVAVEGEGEASVLGEGTQELGKELDVEGPYLLGHRTEVAGEVAPGTEVDHNRTEGLDKRSARVGEARDAAPVTERLVECAAKHEARVL